ncbi:MAG: YbbR-like domain-containing protein [Bacilli bacterium]
MKKTNKNKKNIFKTLIDLFDRYIITPITKFIMRFGDMLKSNKKGLEKVLMNKQALLVISLVAAFAVFYAVDQKTTTLVDNSAEVLYGQPVNAIYNEELYVIEGVPKTADVTLIGRRWDVYLAKQYPADEIILDLQDLKPGTHQVTTKYKQLVSSVEYKLDPSVVTVVVYEKMSANRELTYDILHKDNLDTKLNIESVTLSRDTVIVKGAEYKLEKVASVKALIDVDNLNNPKVGSITLKDVPLVAYDQQGNVLDVEIVPEKVEATIKISSPSKTVPIKIETKGELDNKAIKSLTSNVSTVTVYGTDQALEDVEYVTAEIDIEGIKANKKYNVNLKKPAGVREMSVNKVTINMVVDDIATKEITGVRINSLNLASGLKVQALSKEDSSISVVLSGSESVIKNIDVSKINAYIDLSDLSVGEHEVEIKVSGSDDRVSYTSKIKKVKIRISAE